jgi:hypothetical protein
MLVITIVAIFSRAREIVTCMNRAHRVGGRCRCRRRLHGVSMGVAASHSRKVPLVIQTDLRHCLHERRCFSIAPLSSRVCNGVPVAAAATCFMSAASTRQNLAIFRRHAHTLISLPLHPLHSLQHSCLSILITHFDAPQRRWVRSVSSRQQSTRCSAPCHCLPP